ncbi:NACHT domain-containing protein, partial [Phormidesmis sp. 146-35]
WGRWGASRSSVKVRSSSGLRRMRKGAGIIGEFSRLSILQLILPTYLREALPPTRYELPLDLKRQLQAQGELESDVSLEALKHYRQNYFQQPFQKVLEAVADSQRAVILGDPGAGKSTLLQYLALEWVEGKTKLLPLLIELKEYAVAPVNNFLDFLHRGRGVDWQFDQQQLDQHLLEHSTLVMFDGLDEVFDRSTQSAIIDDIIRFAQQYPKAQILITTRTIGYNPERLQHANFRHFTIQPLDTDEIHEFIDRWYTLALGNGADKPRLVTRLKEAIANSKAIQNLADNPLLLTMMAILNRRQELPRDRADLYDQASRVLLYHWDVDHKRLQLPMDTIGRREKQEMLRLIAYEMQTSEEGLKGNLISADRLTRILTDYLRDQGFGEPREKANRLIDQLRHRNWILCDRGADTYGFVHRTFLEYFCAMEIVYRFEKSRTLTFEQLRDEVFGQHWQDETWHEVLRLICGVVDTSFTCQLVEFLIEKNDESKEFINIFLANECLFQVFSKKDVFHLRLKAFERTKKILQYVYEPNSLGHSEFIGLVNKDPTGYLEAFSLLSESMREDEIEFAHSEEVLDDTEKKMSQLLTLAIEHYAPSVILLVRAIESIAYHYKDIPHSFEFLLHCAKDSSRDFRIIVLENIIRYYSNHPKTIELLHDRSLNDPDEQLRKWAQEQLEKMAGERQ